MKFLWTMWAQFEKLYPLPKLETSPDIHLVAEVIIIRATGWWNPSDEGAPCIVRLDHLNQDAKDLKDGISNISDCM